MSTSAQSQAARLRELQSAWKEAARRLVNEAEALGWQEGQPDLHCPELAEFWAAEAAAYTVYSWAKRGTPATAARLMDSPLSDRTHHGGAVIPR